MLPAFLSTLHPGASQALAREGDFVQERTVSHPQIRVMVRRGLFLSL